MIPEGASVTDRAEALGRAFDVSFAAAPPSTTADFERVLSVRLGPMGYALRLSDIAGVFADVKITPVPTNVPELLGIAAFHGTVLPVYDLRALLGHPVGTRPRWMAVAAATPVGLAFDDLEGQRSVPGDAIVSQRSNDAHLRHVDAVAQLDGTARAIVSVQSVLEEIRTRLGAGTSDKE